MGSFCSKFCFCSDCCLYQQKNARREAIAKDIAINGKISKRQSGSDNRKLDEEVKNEMIDRNIRDIIIDANSDRLSVIVSDDDHVYNLTEQLLLDDERLAFELKV